MVSGVLLALCLQACSSAYYASSVDATDLSGVVAGASAARVSEVLGAPLREWRNAAGIGFRLYEIDGGRPPRSGEAAFMGALALVSLGATELIFLAATKEGPGGIPRRVVVSYDAGDRVLDLFEEFDYLPADGRRSASPAHRR